jgi:hypothetical protein
MATRARGRRNEALVSTASAAVETAGALGVLPGADKAAKLFDAGWLGWAARGIGSTLAPGLIDSNAQAEKATKHAAAVGRMQNMVLPTQVVVGAFRNKLEGNGAADITALYQAAVSAGETGIAAGIMRLVKVWPNEAKEKSRWSSADKAAFAARRASLIQALGALG